MYLRTIRTKYQQKEDCGDDTSKGASGDVKWMLGGMDVI